MELVYFGVKAAIVVFNTNLDVEQCPKLTTHNTAVVRIRTRVWEITVLSVYYEPDKPKPSSIFERFGGGWDLEAY